MLSFPLAMKKNTETCPRRGEKPGRAAKGQDKRHVAIKRCREKERERREENQNEK